MRRPSSKFPPQICLLESNKNLTPHSPHTNANLLQRAEVVALFNTLYRFSESLDAVEEFRRLWKDRDVDSAETETSKRVVSLAWFLENVTDLLTIPATSVSTGWSAAAQQFARRPTARSLQSHRDLHRQRQPLWFRDPGHLGGELADTSFTI